MNLQLQDKVVLVTGGSKGIGRAIVKGFLQEGARVVNVNRAGPEGESLQSEATADGRSYRFLAGDLCDEQTCRRAVAETLQEFGRIDVLVNNAGVNEGVGLSAGVEAFENSLKRNLTHYYALVHYSLEELKASRGVVINVGSKVSVTGQGGTSGYAAAKGAINALTREWAVDLAPFGIRVNTVIPAEVWTPLYEKWLQSLDDPQQTKVVIERLIPLEQRFTTDQEIADMVIFLASPRSAHTTGQILFVDGGYTHLDRKCTTGE